MENIKELVESNYNLIVIKTEKIKNAYKIETTEGLKCLKLSKYDEGQFMFIIKAIKHLCQEGFDSILHPYSTIIGDDYIGFKGGFGYLCDWINAREADFKNPVEVKLCVEALAKLHLKSRGYLPPKETKVRNYYGKWLKKFKKRCDELLYFKAIIVSKETATQFDKEYLKYFDMHYKQALKCICDLEASSYLKVMEDHRNLSSICHHDSANHNFLITKDLNIFMIDFDYCILDSHLHDLGSIILRNLKYNDWDMTRLQFILEVYRELIPISYLEEYLLFCFMEFPQDFWQIGLQYYIEKQPWEEEYFLKRLHRLLGDSKDRFEFLKKYEASFIGRSYDT